MIKSIRHHPHMVGNRGYLGPMCKREGGGSRK